MTPWLLVIAALLALAAWLLLARRADARRLQSVIEHRDARCAALVESSPDAVIATDAEQRIVLFNPAAEALFGLPRGQAIGSPLARFVPEPLRTRHDTLFSQFATSGERQVGQGHVRGVRALKADGREIEVEASAFRFDEPGGRQPLFTVVLRDAAARRAAAEELHRVSERYRRVVEQSPDAIWLAEQGKVQLVNAACVALLGARSADELIGRDVGDFLPPPASGGGDAPLHELQVRRLDGREVTVEMSVASVPDHGGVALQGVMRDISERKRAEAELRRTQTALIEAQRIARLGYFELGAPDAPWQASPSLRELLGRRDAMPLTIDGPDGFVHAEDRAALFAHLRDEVFAGRAALAIEFRILRADDGQLRWQFASGRTEHDGTGRVTRLFGTVQDITERKLAALALETSREELRRLSGSLTWAREAERRHVARELHDELGQRLSALKLDLTALPPQGDRQPLLAQVDEAIAATRRIAADLRPAMLDDLGLNAALEWLAGGWSRRTGMSITLDADPVEQQLSEAAAITVYRVVQEALTNVTRHAQARHVAISLRRRDDELLVAVEDDGRGLAGGATDKRDSTGLAGIRERARLLGGAAAVANRAEGGVRLEVRLPMHRVRAGAEEKA